MVDATAGNGHDTLALAQAVGPGGHVWALDRQAVALEATEERLRAHGCREQVTLIQGNHADWAELLPAELEGNLRLAVFNLGYLPGSDHSLTTCAADTLAALDGARRWLAPAGALSLIAYPGHPGGAEETAVVRAWMAAQAGAGWQWEVLEPSSRSARPSPVWHWLVRTTPGA